MAHLTRSGHDQTGVGEVHLKRVLALTVLLLAVGRDVIAAPSRAGDLEGVWTLGSYTNFQRPKD